MKVTQLQKKQAEYDEKYWEHNASELDKIRHITLHMGKLVGKLSTYCEAKEHGANHPTVQIQEEVVPDLLIYSLQLANLLDLKLDAEYKKRIKKNMDQLME